VKTVVVRYRLKADRVAEHEALLARVFEELAVVKPAGLRYRALKLADGVSFVHLAEHAAADGAGENPLTSLPAFRAFVASIRERCDEPPAASDTTALGAYASA
jgi:hypothetical protein